MAKQLSIEELLSLSKSKKGSYLVKAEGINEVGTIENIVPNGSDHTIEFRRGMKGDQWHLSFENEKFYLVA